MFRKTIQSMVMGTALIVLLSVLAACSKNENAGSPSASTPAASVHASETTEPTESTEPSESVKAPPEEVTLEFFMPSGTADVNDLQAVLDQFYAETKDTLNTKLKFNFTTFDNIGQQVSLKIAGGEQVDSAFTAQWTAPNINQMIAKDQLANLDSYFNNDKYPGLKKAFTPEYLKNNSFIDAKGESHIYGIPFTHGFDGGGVIYYRKDLAEKYGVTEIKSVADLTKYYDAILANEKGVIPLTWNGNQDLLSDTLLTMVQPITEKHNYETNVAGTNSSIAIKPDGTVYVAKTVNPWSDPEFIALIPDSLKSMDPLTGYKLAREWYTKGYLEKDILAQKDPDGQFMSGKAASVVRTLDIYASEKQQLEKAIPGAKLGYFIINPGYLNGTPKAVGSDFKAWNFAAIPSNSKNIERTMQFFDWLFTNQSNHDLFEFGIEGKHWTAEGDTKYSIPAGVDAASNYNFPGFTLSWNPTMVRYDATTPDDVVTTLNNLGDTNFFFKKLSAGFNFVTDNVKNETAKLNDVKSLLRTIGDGVSDDIEGTLAKVQKDFDKAGYAKVREELEKQFNEFLKTNPYEGQ
ncbi:extracellular solute-binding protein [Cohnella herbarum]|uniref:Extracellular solute-binding protein n=1 Tax=Cohnella herbarum TaxID=2728023 RepID=A0A7Z2VQZ1_9BACL|nr:extracellular solute-binding protein [Cohnella herbarum]QJD87467.1 extracellular solute-binding protein [Cohnella herbarum]